MPEPLRILVAEDNDALKRIIDRGLRAHGFDVVSVSGGADAVNVLRADTSIRLVVHDLASADGAAARVEAARSGVPVLWLVAAEHDGDAAHAERTLRKPFAFEELIGRIRALTRAAGEERVTTLAAGDLRIDLLARCAWRGDRAIELPEREFALLEYFVRHADRVLTRQEILTDVWGYNFDSSSNVVDVYVRYLRNKLDEVGESSMIASVRGAGYCFTAPSPSAAGGMKNSYRAGSA
jgi:two-component system, OmpR family, response regulator